LVEVSGITTHERTRALGSALAAVAQACSVTRRVQRDLAGIRRMTKHDRSPVTVADYAAQAVIARRLSRDLGAPAMIGEENAAALRGDEHRALRDAVTEAVRSVWPDAADDDVLDAIDLGNHDASGESYWTFDPVDGTKGFLRGGQYAVSLALIDQGRVVLGVLGCPNLSADFERPFDDPDPQGCLYYAVEGGGAWYLPAADISREPRSVATSDDRSLEAIRVCESVEASHSRLDDSARIMRHLNARGRPARLDSQCKYAVVARGQADAYLRLPTSRAYVEKIWDHAAGMIVAEEAGAIVSDIDGKPLDFSHGATLSANRGVICAPAQYHPHIIGAIEQLGIGER
jgi:3'(2'), 5'-bisphosphate nucleotidase